MPVTLTRAAPWEQAFADPDVALAGLRLRFPATVCWRGEYTGSFFAAVTDPNGELRLVETATTDELAAELEKACRHVAALSTSTERDLTGPATQPGEPVTWSPRHEAPKRRLQDFLPLIRIVISRRR